MEILERIEIGEFTKSLIFRILAQNLEKGCSDPDLLQVLTRFSFDTFFGALNNDDISFLRDYAPMPDDVKDEIDRRVKAAPEDTVSPQLVIALAGILASLILELVRSWDEEGVLWQFAAEYGGKLNANM